MSHDEFVFVTVWLVNLMIAVVYFLWGTGAFVPLLKFIKRSKVSEGEDGREKSDDDRQKVKAQPSKTKVTIFVRSIVMALCPVVGPLFFLMGHLVFKTIFRQSVDLEDVIFSKERVRMHLKADEERERNMVPLEEALAVSDAKNLRILMMNVIRGDLKNSLESMMLALNSGDSETSHYAASALRDELNTFRMNVSRLFEEIGNETQQETECEQMLLDYMDGILKQKIFSDIEQKSFVDILEQTAASLYKKDRQMMTPQRYESVFLKLLDIPDFEKAEFWYGRLKTQYPKVLETYTCALKLYFKLNDREHFFEVLDELKRSDVTVDSGTLEVIRIFSQT